MTATDGRCQGDRGQVGGIESLPFAFLIFVSLTLFLANVWGVIDAKMAVTSAAIQGVRVASETSDLGAAASQAEAIAQETLVAHGRSGERAEIGPLQVEDGFGRCAQTSLTVSYEVPAILIPFIGGFGGSITVESTATERIDPFRDGLAGGATC